MLKNSSTSWFEPLTLWLTMGLWVLCPNNLSGSEINIHRSVICRNIPMDIDWLILVGGLEHGFYFSISWECHHPNWRTPFFRGVETNHQPVSLCHTWSTSFFYPAAARAKELPWTESKPHLGGWHLLHWTPVWRLQHVKCHGEDFLRFVLKKWLVNNVNISL